MVEILRTIITIVFLVLSVIMVVLILMQESKTSGLSGAISGAADTYWGKNKSRSVEGKLKQFTKALAVLFFILAIVLNMGW